jgi:hypothetical protein
VAGVGQQRGDGSIADRSAEAIYTVPCRQIIFDRFDSRAKAGELGASLMQWSIRCDDQVEPAARGFGSELATDPARCTREDGKRLVRGRRMLSGHAAVSINSSLLSLTQSPMFLA